MKNLLWPLHSFVLIGVEKLKESMQSTQSLVLHSVLCIRMRIEG
jgi:hypothetical protein